MKKSKTSKDKELPQWNLKLLYNSPFDPQIELDMKAVENMALRFSKKYNLSTKTYLYDSRSLLTALNDFEMLYEQLTFKPLLYFSYMESIDCDNAFVIAQLSILVERATKISNSIMFFVLELGSISSSKQKDFLASNELLRYHFFLKCIFNDAKYKLSLPEEKILALESYPANGLWVSHNEKILNSRTVTWKGRNIPISEAQNLVAEQKSTKLRKKLADLIYKELKFVAQFSEGEINAICIEKKINDELRGLKTPFDNTVMAYRNDPDVIENLVKVVSDNFHIAHRFYKIKARLLKQKKLSYYDRSAKIGSTKSTYTFQESLSILKDIFGNIDPKYVQILDAMVREGRIDAMPRKGKRGGAYCSSTYSSPTFVLLNHVNNLNSLTTFAHEMGHAFHGELSRSQGPIYSEYSYSLAETASTLFEAIVEDAIFDKLSDKDKIIALHDKIDGDIATIFRQIGCFNFENELHQTIRAKGFVSKEEICDIHNINMQAYLGPVFDLKLEDGYMFVSWSHIRRFFYVYSYSYGSLVSKALLRRYRNDPTFWKKIELFLSAGGKDSPENILNEIGLDIRTPNFFREGLREIEDNIAKLEKLIAR